MTCVEGVICVRVLRLGASVATSSKLSPFYRGLNFWNRVWGMLYDHSHTFDNYSGFHVNTLHPLIAEHGS